MSECFCCRLETYRPFGLEVLEQRYGGQRARLSTLHDRLRELIEGRVNCIEELEDEPVRFVEDSQARLALCYSRCATGCATYITGEAWRG